MHFLSYTKQAMRVIIANALTEILKNSAYLMINRQPVNYQLVIDGLPTNRTLLITHLWVTNLRLSRSPNDPPLIF